MIDKAECVLNVGVFEVQSKYVVCANKKLQHSMPRQRCVRMDFVKIDLSQKNQRTAIGINRDVFDLSQ